MKNSCKTTTVYTSPKSSKTSKRSTSLNLLDIAPATFI
ncbi:hypothetical protein KPSA1_05155 [Pseudomonas syringae pv. actinidiae]|uniref:Uncharacterized protein n=1 Tax=Pseudomonas syringae pv. actinidiae TaxID=103796 RepID=A0A2V0QR23_PSESF|nr:hypothetical protein KPSA1_05155 [Pseudomonas syringae pv. actinidiae]